MVNIFVTIKIRQKEQLVKDQETIRLIVYVEDVVEKLSIDNTRHAGLADIPELKLEDVNIFE